MRDAEPPKASAATLAPGAPGRLTDDVLRVAGVSKSYPGTQALVDADLTVRRGEVHALLGPNGAGKSTLAKILAGIVRPDSGAIEVNGEIAEIHRPPDAAAYGLRFIHQQLQDVGRLTVADNVFLGERMPTQAGVFVADRTLAEAARARLEGFTDVDPRRRQDSLSLAERWLVAIARACAGDPVLVVMDEPTTALADHEVHRVFTAVDELRRRGVAIVYVSHRLNEVLRLADSVTVLRDGRVIAAEPIEGHTSASLTRLITQMEAAQVEPVVSVEKAESRREVLSVRNLCGKRVQDVTFEGHAGEVIGVGGLIGSGRSELLRLLYEQRRSAGEVKVEGELRQLGSPEASIASGIAYLPEDRLASALLPRRSIRANVALPFLSRLRYRRTPVPSKRGELALASAAISRMEIRASGPEEIVGNLSGGNQQKVLFARALHADASVYLLDEPTKGLDVGAKRELFAAIHALAEQGKLIVFVSSDLQEVAASASRILVMREGRLVGELPGPSTEEAILDHCYREDE